MACNYTVDLSTLSGTASRYSYDWNIGTSFISLAGQNGKEIRSIQIRMGAAQAGNLQFIYILAWKTSSGVTDYYEVKAVSGPHTITAGSVGILTYTITPILIPNDGRVYYGMIQQGVRGGLNYDIMWPTNGMAGGVDVSQGFTSYVTVGTSIPFSPAWNNTQYVCSLAEEVCDVSVQQTFTSEGLSGSNSISVPTISMTIPLAAANMTTATDVGNAPLTNSIPLTTDNLAISTFTADVNYTRQGDFIGEEVGPTVSVDTATLTQTIPLAPGTLTIGSTVSQASVNRALTLTAENLSMLPAVQSAVNFSLSTMGLSSNSSRTPDAGITLDWEESGVPKAYSWYDKVLYRFHLEFDQITEEQCLLLEDFCEIHRYDEIDYQWPFDNHTYRCVLIEDVKERIIRSDTALGVRCVASVELLGYEVA